MCKQVALPELDDYKKIVDAKYTGKLLVLTAVKKDGQYDRMTLLFSSNFDEYVVRVKENITPMGINLTVNDAGVCVLLNDDEQVEAFQANRHAPVVKEFDADPMLTGDVKLFHDGATILFSKDDILYSMKMKKK